MSAPTTHEQMILAAEWLARQGFAVIGWAPVTDGKAPHRRWKSDATDDPALVARLLGGARNALVIPKHRALVIDADDPRAWGELEAAGLPRTFRVDSPTPGHGHAYVWAPPDVDMASIPGSFEWGEIRRSTNDERTSSMVLGPYSTRADGVYKPHDGVREIATLPASVVEYLRGSKRRKTERQSSASSPDDDDWYIEKGKHDFLVGKARHLRGVGVAGERLLDELLRLDAERNRPPIATIPGRGREEIESIAGWTNAKIADDPPDITIVFGRDDPKPACDISARSDKRWPDPAADAAYHGLAGEVVAAISPHTEADRVAILGQFLTAYGCAVGPGPTLRVGVTDHPARLFIVLVGQSSRARKGDSWAGVREVMYRADPAWTTEHLISGVGSGEALIWNVRDPLVRGGEVVDPGISDKRLLVHEPEFGRILRVAGRPGSVLSMILRDAWDRGDLRTVTKNAPARATGAHIGVVAHITIPELRREMAATDVLNGYANRHIWLAVKRWQLLPIPEPFTVPDRLATKVTNAIIAASEFGPIQRHIDADARWREVYPHLTREIPGRLGSVLARAEAQVVRLSLIYALLDGSHLIRVEHLEAALALWDYAERSAGYLFGDSTGDVLADRILDALRVKGPMDRTDIRDLLGRHVTEDRVDMAVASLEALGLASMHRVTTGGRPREVWAVVGG